MVDETKRTPGPWKAAHSDPAYGADVWWICAGEDNYEKELVEVSGSPHEVGAANAAFIVRTCNSFDSNQATIKALREALELLVADVADYEAWQRPCHALDVARAVLALAKK